MANPFHLAEIMDNIVHIAWEGLADTTSGQPTDHYVAHGPPAVDCCDLVVAYAEYVRPSVGFGVQAQYVTGGRVLDQCGNVGRVADIVIELWRPCYPTVVDNAYSPFPPAEDIDAASKSLLEDAWVLQCALISASCNGTIFPPYIGQHCLNVAWGDMKPLGPKGGCAGWSWLLTLELDMSTCGS